jgi:hypothetical protein
MASASLPAPLRGSGLALLATVTNIARLLASVLFGAIWHWTGLTNAIAVFGGALLVAIVAAYLTLRTGPEPIDPLQPGTA